MVLRIGGGGNGGPRAGGNAPKPQNSGLGNRARQRIEATADLQAAQRQEAINADGTPVLVWKRTSGALPCTCSTRATGEAPHGVSVDEVGHGTSVPGTVQQDSNALSDYDTVFDEVDILAGDDFPSPVQRVTGKDSGWLNQVVEAGSFESGQTIKCPVCFGSSYTDTWQPYKSLRILGDLSEHVQWEDVGGNLRDDANPSLMVLPEGASITWTLFVPKYFTRVVRSVVWNGMNAVDVIPEMLVDDAWVPANTASLRRLQGRGGDTQFRVVSDDGELRLTHFEILVLIDDFVLGSIPTLDIPYDGDFVDYNTTTTIDLPVEVDLNEGDIVSENKHGRLWQASSVEKNRTASGKIIDMTATFRAVSSTEVYVNMDIFRAVKA